MNTCCEVCGAFLEKCRCPPCWVCGAVEPSCNDNHRFRTHRAALAALLEQSGNNYLAAAKRLGIHNTHLYRAGTNHYSPMLKKALYKNGYMYVKKKRFRLAADFEDEAERQAFVENVLGDTSFTEWVMEQGE